MTNQFDRKKLEALIKETRSPTKNDNKEEALFEGKITKASQARVYKNNKNRVGKTYIDDVGDEIRKSMVLFINNRYMHLVYEQLGRYVLKYQNFDTLKVKEFKITPEELKVLQKFKG